MLTYNDPNIIMGYGQSPFICNGSNMDRKTLSIPEAARVLGIGRSAAYQAARAGELPTIRIGRRVLVPVVALERVLGRIDADAA